MVSNLYELYKGLNSNQVDLIQFLYFPLGLYRWTYQVGYILEKTWCSHWNRSIWVVFHSYTCFGILCKQFSVLFFPFTCFKVVYSPKLWNVSLSFYWQIRIYFDDHMLIVGKLILLLHNSQWYARKNH